MPHHTPWKKSRKYGDIYGGRRHRKYADNIFSRLHSIQKPSATDVLPIVRTDNPSREFFHPLCAGEILKSLKSLPKDDYEQITHIWLRRPKKQDYIDGQLPFAQFICGSGVRLIVMYAWPNDMTVRYGKTRPSGRTLTDLKKHGIKLEKNGKDWISRWDIGSVRRFTIHVLFHEVGHHIDWYFRHWSKANSKQREDDAERYAYCRASNGNLVFDKLENQRDF